MTKRKKEVVYIDSAEKKEFKIDWDSALDEDGAGKEDTVPELEIVKSKTPPPETLFSDHQMEYQKPLADRDLDDQLERHKTYLVNYGPTLPDKGEKIRFKIASLEEEKNRRVLQRSKMDVEGSSTLTHSHSTSSCSHSTSSCSHSTSSGSDVFAQANTASKDTSRQGNSDSKEVSRSTFSAFFSKPKTDTQPSKAFGKELEDLGCESRKPKADKKPIPRPNNGWRMLSKIGKTEHSEKQFYSGNNISKENKKSKESYARKKPKESSSYSLLDDDDPDFIPHETHREWSWQGFSSQDSRRRKLQKPDNTVINVDEEDPQPSAVAEQAVELPEGLHEDICYPSRDDPDFVQVCRQDLDCLAPREFLTSPVMNFYIRFLQQQVSSANQISADCHFFNTYFYKKLSDAVSYKGNDKDAFFVKFRRWWKGIDLFRKAYIFIPIHEDLHWSLVIVCIPDKEDESGLTVLHLDSLGLHSRRSIVENVKRFLKDEWNYLNTDDYSSDLPISEKIWKHLPRRITEADIQVPQQKNDFDCGPFVLFFIKRFIEEAPQRLKRKDLGMFDKKWFRPDEASALRIKIRNILIDLFQASNQTNCNDDQTNCNDDQTDKSCIEPKISDDENEASISRHCSPL